MVDLKPPGNSSILRQGRSMGGFVAHFDSHLSVITTHLILVWGTQHCRVKKKRKVS